MNLHYMLGTSKVLNTSNIYSYYSESVKDVTMSNQQVAKKTKDLNIIRRNIITFFLADISLFGNLRDYTWRIFTHKQLCEWLRYSPVFCKIIKGIDIIKTSPRWAHFPRASKLSTNSNQAFALSTYLYPHSSTDLDPNWVTGFADAEGSFSVIVEIPEPSKWKVRTSFEINSHENDREILYKIQSFFGVGGVYHRLDRKISVYRVTNIKYIKDIIIPHFSRYPLITQKRVDFLLWAQVVNMIYSKQYKNKEGFLNILSCYASINRGVSKKVLMHYPDIVRCDKPLINLPDQLNPWWVSGFIAGDGGFSIYLRYAKDYDIKEKVYCRFHITQHSKDLELLKLFIKFFSCGVVDMRSNPLTPRCDFFVQDIGSLLEKVIPHFDSYPLLNLKQKDFICFKEALIIIKLKDHLTPEGLNKIKELNLEMNTNRLI